VAREGFEYGVLHRQVALGGQQLTLRGLSREFDDIYLPLYGAYQAHNAATALAAVEAFLGAGRGGATLDPDVVREAFAKVTSPGRLEVVRRGPTVIVDATHNPAGARVTAAALADEFAFDHLVGVVAALRDKDVAGILEILEPVLAEVVITRNSSERSLPVSELADLAREVFDDDRVHEAKRLDDAIDLALGLAEQAVPAGTSGGAGVIVTGSVVTAGDARKLLVRRRAERVEDRHSFENVSFEDAEAEAGNSFKEDFDDRDFGPFGAGGGDRRGGDGDAEDLEDREDMEDFEGSGSSRDDDFGGDDR
jgi:dihydrofolate synthase/folylpolyglutamate synthase